MSPTTDDLSALLTERVAADPAAAATNARLAGVRAKVRRTRQVRTAVTAGSLAVLVAGAAAAAFGGFLPSQDRGLPADPVPRMPATYLGRTLLTSTSLEASGGEGAKDWTVGVRPSLRQALVARCEGATAPDAVTAVQVGPRRYDLPCDGSARTLAAGVVLVDDGSGTGVPTSAVGLGPGPVALSADPVAGVDGAAVVTLGLYEGDATPLVTEPLPFDDAGVQIAVVDIDATVQEGTQGSDARGTGRLWVTVECQDDPAVRQQDYSIEWELPGVGRTSLSCNGNGELSRLEDSSVTFTRARPVGVVTYRVVRKNPVTQEWEPASQRGPAFRARLTLWITKGSGPMPTS